MVSRRMIFEEFSEMNFPSKVPSSMDPWDYVSLVEELNGTLPNEEFNPNGTPWNW